MVSTTSFFFKVSLYLGVFFIGDIYEVKDLYVNISNYNF